MAKQIKEKEFQGTYIEDTKGTEELLRNIDELPEAETSKEVTEKSMVTKEQGDKIFKTLAAAKGTPLNTTIAAAFTLLQEGATNSGMPPTYTVNVNTYAFSKDDLLKAYAQVIPGKRPYLRRLARTYANEIFTYCKKYGKAGDLAKQMALKEPTLTVEELCWCSTFQTYNPKCPEKIKNMLLTDLNERFKSKVKKK